MTKGDGSGSSWGVHPLPPDAAPLAMLLELSSSWIAPRMCPISCVKMSMAVCMLSAGILTTAVAVEFCVGVTVV